MSGDISRYLGLVTSEHADKPNFLASVAASIQPFADILDTLNSFPSVFDIDNAVGAQLDVVGQWVGASRNVATPLTGVYFSFDDPTLGWDQGVWYSAGEPTTGLTALPDDIYRLLLRAKIAANQWDGTIPGAYAAWDQLFAAEGFRILIQDNGDMTMTLGLMDAGNSPTFRDLFSGGYLDLRPAGVLIDSYLFPSVDAPFFGFDAEDGSVSGFDVGAWAQTVPATSSLLFVSGSQLFFNNGGIRLIF